VTEYKTPRGGSLNWLFALLLPFNAGTWRTAVNPAAAIAGFQANQLQSHRANDIVAFTAALPNWPACRSRAGASACS